MNRRIGFMLAALTAIFILLIGWLGRQLTIGEKEALLKEQVIVADTLLSQFSSRASSLLHSVGEDISGSYKLSLSIETLREFYLNNPYLTGGFMIDNSQRILFPKGNLDEDESEQELLKIIKPLIKTGLFIDDNLDEKQEQFNRKKFFWRSAHLDNGLNLFLMLKLQGGETIGLRINRSRILADLVVFLGGQGKELPFQTVIELLTDDGSRLGSWGGSFLDVGSPSPKIKRELSLAPPLQSFRLVLSQPEIPIGVRSGNFYLTAGILLLGVTIVLLGVFAFREYQRELREAETRINFVGQVSHELRTPLTNIRLYAELMEQRVECEDEVSLKYLRIIVQESERLSRLIGNVLRLSESDSGKLKVKLTSGRICSVLESVIDLYRPAFENIGMSIKTEFTNADNIRKFDRDALAQIIHNVLSNAEKYAKRGVVTLLMKDNQDQVIITVSDEGEGIPESLREQVFEPFFRVSNSLTDGVTGTGIGLGISRELARLHGGDLILLDSKVGLTLQLTLDAPRVEGEGLV
ncbi:MAG TPA: HAMP domain-containing sensor histidine kinase [Oligoflexia bacterium]|nr:HAMP domain-containing sensor histidine kinase [Oligoflexia bacterium]HMP49237.1 HAMP domain-containing sensor histidine kinase [Oligoflexia bacterium]